MILIFPLVILFATCLVLIIIKIFHQNFRFSWIIASLGAFFSVISIILWQIKMPFSISLPTWKPETIFHVTPSWVVDGYSWVYAICLATLTFSVIFTAVIRKNSRSINWAAILFVTAIGLLAVTSQNLTSVVIAWIGLDLVELIFWLYTNNATRSEEIVISFVSRLVGVLLISWSSILSYIPGSLVNLGTIPEAAGILIISAFIFRLGIIPFHLPRKGEESNHGVMTVFRLISAGSALAIISRIPIASLPTNFQSYLLLIGELLSITGSLLWLFSPDGFSGLTYWIFSLSGLALSSTVIGNPVGSISCAITMILGGGLIFMYSHRNRKNLWLPILGLIGISTIPFSATASVWSNSISTNLIILIPQVISLSIIGAGYIKHALLPDETSSKNSEPDWITTTYKIGLFSLVFVLILLGLWGWQGARIINTWWISGVVIILSLLIYLTVRRQTEKLDRFQISASQFHSNLISNSFWMVYRAIRQVVQLITTILEGDAGILWSIVVMVLIITLFLQMAPGTQ